MEKTKQKQTLSVNAEIASVQFSTQIHICNQQHFFFFLSMSFITFLKEILGKLEISLQKYSLVPCRKKVKQKDFIENLHNKFFSDENTKQYSQ